MREYHKIQTMFKRDLKTNKIMEGVWTLPEFEFLKDNKWIFTEKVDGTNIRVMWDDSFIKFGGKTDNAQTPMDLINHLQNVFKNKEPLLREMFVPKPDEVLQICLYGEGYGAGIQKGGCYKPTKDFVLFDVKIGDWWLQREDVEEIAQKLSLDIVPVVGEGTLQEGIDLVKNGLKSKWGDFVAEGIVARTKIEFKTRRGDRMITKIKYKDFK